MIWTGKYFSLHELTKSPTAMRYGIDNKPNESVKYALLALVKNVLDPLREAWGAPIIVSSGYRCVQLNAKVGGARSSQHVYGQAVDIHTVSDKPEDNKKLRDLLIELNLPYDQLIDEFGCNWLHVSHRTGVNRGQILSAVSKGGKTVYLPGCK